MTMCLLEISFRLLPGKHREFSQSLVMLMRAEGEGHRKTLVYDERDEPDHLLWVEEWTDRAMLERHLETGLFKTLMGGLRALATVDDCRIVDLGSKQPLGEVLARKPRYLEGRTIPDNN